MHYYGPPQARKNLWFYYSQMVIYEYFGSASGENFANEKYIGSCGNSTQKLKMKLWKLKRKLWKVSESEKQIVENGKLWKIWEQVVENLRASCGNFGSNLWK